MVDADTDAARWLVARVDECWGRHGGSGAVSSFCSGKELGGRSPALEDSGREGNTPAAQIRVASVIALISRSWFRV